MSIIKESCSYSRYRGVTCPDRYDAVDDFFKYEVDGSIICSDDERDIACDGNIIMITKKGDVLHLGTIPQLEAGAGRVKFSLNNENNLVLRFKVFLDCDHHHADIEEEVIDTHLTDERKAIIERNNLIAYLAENLRGFNGGSYRNVMRMYASSPEYDRDYEQIEVCVNVVKLYRYSRSESHFKAILKKEDGKYQVQQSEDFEKFKEIPVFKGYPNYGITPLQKVLDEYYKTI